MKTKLLIIYYIFVFVAAGLFLSLFRGSTLNADLVIYTLPIIGLLLLTTLLVSLSYATPRVLHKKNLLRISALIVGILFISNFVSRIIELFNGTFCITCSILGVIYLILFVILIKILKNLYKLVQEIF